MLGIGLFKFNTETKQLQINKGLVTMVKSFRDVLKRKNGLLELVYVYLMAEATSENPFFSYVPKKGETLKSVIVNYIGLPISWTPDSDIEKAIKDYEKLQNEISPTIKSIKAAKEALTNTNEALSIIGIQNKELIEQVKIKLKNTSSLTTTTIAEINTYLSLIIQNSKNITSMIDDLEGSFNRIQDLEDKYQRNFAKAALAKGNNIIGDYENPDNYQDINLLS